MGTARAMSTAPYEYKSTDMGSEGGGLYQEMLERQRMHRDFETYVASKDEADTAEKTKECLLHVTGKSSLCMPMIKRTACTGVTQSMNNIREQRELSHINFEDDNEALRDAMYEQSEFAAELEDETYGDPLGISARHSPTGRGEVAKNKTEYRPIAATPATANEMVKTASQMNPAIPVESLVLKADGTFEHRDTAEWYCWKNGEDAHDG